MIVCPNCGKENQDHYKFCLGCGAKLPPAGQAAAPQAPAPPPVAPPAPRAAPPPIPAPAPAPPAAAPPPAPAPQAPPPNYAGPGSQPQHGQQPGPYGQPQQGTYGQQPAPPQSGPYGSQPGSGSGPAMRNCPSCQTPNPAQFKFCGACGTPLQQASSQPAAPAGAQPPQPAAQPSTSPAPGADAAPAKTMFMDANQRPPMAGGVATIKLALLREDGSEGGVLVINGGPETIGRGHGPPFDQDAYLDLDHANLTASQEGLVVDSTSLNGVYVKLEGRAELQHSDFFRVGQELLMYEDLPEPTPTVDGTERMGSPNPGYWGRVSVMVSPTQIVAGYPIADEGVDIGREDGDITFPDDGYVSGAHCRVFGNDEGVFIEDLGSSNGTYMRVRPGQLVRPGSLLLVGQQLFRVDIG